MLMLHIFSNVVLDLLLFSCFLLSSSVVSSASADIDISGVLTSKKTSENILRKRDMGRPLYVG